MNRGFSLLEVLISLLLAALLMLIVFSILDSAQWLYLRNEKEINIQQIARTTLAMLEKDMRMIGYGVPSGSDINGSSGRWQPCIWLAEEDALYFRADIDDETSLLTRNVTPSDTRLYIEHFPPGRDLPFSFLLTRKEAVWENATAISLESDADGNSYLRLSQPVVGSYPSSSSILSAPEHICYRFVPEEDYPFGTVERLEIKSPLPLVEVPDDSEFVSIATNVVALTFRYLTRSGESLETPVEDPSRIGRIVVRLLCRDRADRPGRYQDIDLTSEILIRNKVR